MSPCFPGLVLVFLDGECGARTSLGASKSEKETSAMGVGDGNRRKGDTVVNCSHYATSLTGKWLASPNVHFRDAKGNVVRAQSLGLRVWMGPRPCPFLS